MSDVAALVDAYLAHHFTFRPVDASFMGIAGHDHRLPPAAPDTAAAERTGLAALRAMLTATPEGDSVGERLDRRLVEAQVTLTDAALDASPRLANPAWYTGEAAFAIIGLLLPRAAPVDPAAIAARLAAIPDFLAEGQANLIAAPSVITARARREAASFAAFLRGDMRQHPDWQPGWADTATAAAGALDSFSAAIAQLPDRPAATGRAYLETLMHAGHGLEFDAAAALAKVDADYARLTVELAQLAAANDPTQTWEQQAEALGQHTAAAPETVIDLYRALDARAVADAAPLVTPATEFGLEYRWLPAYFAAVARDLYFLPYRSPPGGAPGDGSIYWVHPPSEPAADYLRGNDVASVKIIHAVHHGSIGHHTQNARARSAQSRMARIAGTDCALGLAMISAGTMVEGWACYVQDLMAEAPDFYSPTEQVLLKQFERRNAASVLVDIRLHTGEWSREQAIAFYRSAGFAEARVEGEVTRNLMLPGTRLMYWLGIEMIRDLRQRWKADTRSFHDTLIGHGNVPIAWAGAEMARAGLLD